MKLLLYGAILCLSITGRLKPTKAYCCPGTFSHCGSFCCGNGACNIFCCNCGCGKKCGCQGMNDMEIIWMESGRPKWKIGKYLWAKMCRDGLVRRNCQNANETEFQSPEIYSEYFERYSRDANVYFKTIDTDNDNFLTMEEAKVHFEKHTGNKRSIVEPWEQGVKELDVNNDGMISPEEFDESLKNI